MNTKQNNESRTRLWVLLFLGLLGGYGLTAQPVAAAPFAYVANTIFSNNVSVIDMGTEPNTVKYTITTVDGLNGYPAAIAVTPDGNHVYVTNYNGYVSVIDVTTNKVVIDIPVGAYPLNLAITMDGTRVYVANRYSNTVSVIDTATNMLVGTISGGSGGVLDYPGSIAVAPDGKHVYVTNDNNYSVSVIDTVSSAVVKEIPVSGHPLALTVTPDGEHVYVTDNSSNYVSVIDMATYAVNVIFIPGYFPSIVAAPDGKHVYMTNYFSNNLQVIDTLTNTVNPNPIYVGGAPLGLAVTPDSKHIYVTNYFYNTVSVFDTATNALSSIGVGNYPWSVAMAMPIVSTTPPEINSIVASPSTLWPPNHKLVPVSIAVTATDIGDASPKCTIVSVTSNEPVLGPGSGNTDPDWIISDPGPKVSPATLGVQLRSERAGGGTGRVYTINVSCSDASGNTTPGKTTVTVVHNNQGGKP